MRAASSTNGAVAVANGSTKAAVVALEIEDAPPAPPVWLGPGLHALLSAISLHAATAGACTLLSLQNSSYTLLRRYSTGVLHERASSQAILAVGELIKLAFSFCMIMREHAAGKRDGKPGAEYAVGGPRWFAAVGARLVATSAQMLVPALIFLAMNLLSFVALRRISASAFTLIQQTKIIATAVLARLLLDKRISAARWRALIALFFAVLVICDQTHPDTAGGCPIASAAAAAAAEDSTDESLASHAIPASARALGAAAPSADSRALATVMRARHERLLASRAAEAAEYAIGVGAVGLEAALSGLSNVYFEKVLKTTPLSLWERNVQLATWSLFIYVPMAYYAHPHNLLDGWSSLTFLVACLGALGGILIGLVLKYCDAIVKNLALSTAIITTAVLDWAYFAGPMTTPIVAAAGIIIVSIVTYQSAPG